jgi:hypothetical protein
LKERFGIGPTTPSFGSRLPDMVGRSSPEEYQVEVEAEISRLLTLYQEHQLAIITSALNNGEPIPYSRHDILDEVNTIESRVDGDRLVVSVVVSTAARRALSLEVQVNTLDETIEVNAGG